MTAQRGEEPKGVGLSIILSSGDEGVERPVKAQSILDLWIAGHDFVSNFHDVIQDAPAKLRTVLQVG